MRLSTLGMLVLAMCTVIVGSSHAGPIYNVDRSIGVGSVTGTLETDGTLGVFALSNVIDWNLTVSDGVTAVDLFGPLSGANSVSGSVGGVALATPTDIFFDFEPQKKLVYFF